MAPLTRFLHLWHPLGVYFDCKWPSAPSTHICQVVRYHSAIYQSRKWCGWHFWRSFCARTTSFPPKFGRWTGNHAAPTNAHIQGHESRDRTHKKGPFRCGHKQAQISVTKTASICHVDVTFPFQIAPNVSGRTKLTTTDHYFHVWNVPRIMSTHPYLSINSTNNTLNYLSFKILHAFIALIV